MGRVAKIACHVAFRLQVKTKCLRELTGGMKAGADRCDREPRRACQLQEYALVPSREDRVPWVQGKTEPLLQPPAKKVTRSAVQIAVIVEFVPVVVGYSALSALLAECVDFPQLSTNALPGLRFGVFGPAEILPDAACAAIEPAPGVVLHPLVLQ